MTNPLRDLVEGEAESVEFFQLVRLLQGLYPERAPVGEEHARAAKELVRFSTSRSLAFAGTEVAELDLPIGDAPGRMVVNFIGLTGPQGVLPTEYTCLVADRVRQHDTALRDFLDIFHHRVVSQFYQAWEKSHFFAARERGEADRFSEHVADLAGVGVPEVRSRLAVDPEALMYYVGLMAPRQRSAAALEQLVADYFDVHASVLQFTGGWRYLDESTQCALGAESGASEELGFGAVVGDAVFDPQAGICIRLGPLTRERYADFLPGAPDHDALRELVRFFTGDRFELTVQLVLMADEVPQCHLDLDLPDSPALGWLTWLDPGAPMQHDPDDVVLAL